MQLRKADMHDYHSEANRFQFSGIPFSKVKALHCSSENPMQVQYKTKFSDKEWTDRWKAECGQLNLEHIIRRKTKI